MSAPFLTIAIPTFNRLAYLREALRSSLEQTYSSYEVLISDDGASDELREFCELQARAEVRVRYIHTPKRLGLSGNWNWCAAHARGTHLVIIGDDDRLKRSFLEALGPQTARFDVVFSDHLLIDADGAEIPASAQLLARYGRHEIPPGAVLDAEAVAWMNAVAPSAALVRTDLARRLRFDPDLNTPELDFFTRAAAEGCSFCFVPTKLAEYRVHPASATSGGLTMLRLYRKLRAIPAHGVLGRAARRRQLGQLAPVALVESVMEGDSASVRQLALDRSTWRSLRGGLLALAALASPDLLRGAVRNRRRQSP